MKNYYKILGVANKASVTDIKKAYMKNVKETHPDSNPSDPYANEKMAEVNEAYQTLSDPIKRASYDATLNQNKNTYSGENSNNSNSTSSKSQMNNSRWNKKNIIIAIVVIIILNAFNSNSSSNNTTEAKDIVKPTPTKKVITPTAIPTSTPTQTTTPSPIPTPIPLSSVQQNYQNVTVDEVSKYPSDYLNKSIVLSCTVVSFAKDSKGDATDFNCYDPVDPNSIIMIEANAFDVTQININDKVQVYGLGDGAYSGTNPYGGSVTESYVLGTYIIDSTSDYSDTFSSITP
jgi:hypothetical protein